ncbi:4Fe-4S dicluster domain-containing protein [Chloroflexota bacterium]
MQMAFYFDQTLCTGCYACIVACKDWHDIPAGPASWRRVECIEQGKFPDVFAAYLSTSCYHCINPTCIPACPVGAISKTETDGLMVVDSEKCLGKDVCGMACKLACPYEAPQFGDEDNARMQMCNFCSDRLEENKEPICVAACPMRALDAGPLNKLQDKYGNIGKATGFTYDSENKPSIIFKPKEWAC